MNESDIGWLLQTIEDPETAERFVAAQYHRGRISYEVMTDISRERGWISRMKASLRKYVTQLSTRPQ